MRYDAFKEKLLTLFEAEKLAAAPEDWGFSNECKKEIRALGFATNLTLETIEGARKKGVDCLLTHHDAWEFLYGLKDACIQKLKDYAIVHAFFHLPLDDAPFGTSATLAERIGLLNTENVIPYKGVFMAGVIGTLPQPLSFEAFARRLSEILSSPVRSFKNHERTITRVCVVGGGGNMTRDMKEAFDARCDAYVTGEYGLYSQLYASFCAVDFFVGSHTSTERFGVERFAKLLSAETDVQCVHIPETRY